MQSLLARLRYQAFQLDHRLARVINLSANQSQASTLRIDLVRPTAMLSSSNSEADYLLITGCNTNIAST